VAQGKGQNSSTGYFLERKKGNCHSTFPDKPATENETVDFGGVT
jgi:hypothetical protein